jgi:hypothetical protein
MNTGLMAQMQNTTPERARPNTKSHGRGKGGIGLDTTSNLSDDNLSANLVAEVLLTPQNLFKGNLHPHELYQEHENHEVMKARHSNISDLRRKGNPYSMSKSPMSAKSGLPFQSLEQFLNEMFDEQFVKLAEHVKKVHSTQTNTGMEGDAKT